ncbi:hypothetical protein C480_18242 [Natrialba aegyptia DSM 13077]|uniref:Uncharacterized protein n=2 Tax=Natrialba aegyptia TaxID=129789 RepID=M0ASV7_9EURY|nr:hypothetical protein C480_18242 [Natrialba aegyptia DSM 13077]
MLLSLHIFIHARDEPLDAVIARCRDHVKKVSLFKHQKYTRGVEFSISVEAPRMNPTDVADVVNESANNVADSVTLVLARIALWIVIIGVPNWEHRSCEVNVVLPC